MSSLIWKARQPPIWKANGTEKWGLLQRASRVTGACPLPTGCIVWCGNVIGVVSREDGEDVVWDDHRECWGAAQRAPWTCLLCGIKELERSHQVPGGEDVDPFSFPLCSSPVYGFWGLQGFSYSASWPWAPISSAALRAAQPSLHEFGSCEPAKASGWSLLQQADFKEAIFFANYYCRTLLICSICWEKIAIFPDLSLQR